MTFNFIAYYNCKDEISVCEIFKQHYTERLQKASKEERRELLGSLKQVEDLLASHIQKAADMDKEIEDLDKMVENDSSLAVAIVHRNKDVDILHDDASFFIRYYQSVKDAVDTLPGSRNTNYEIQIRPKTEFEEIQARRNKLFEDLDTLNRLLIGV